MYCGVILTLVAVAAKESAERGNIVMKMMIMMIQARRGIVKIPSSLNSPHVLMMAIMMVYQTDKGDCCDDSEDNEQTTGQVNVVSSQPTNGVT
ncbi:uncharacterized protein [Penaeus vannamei]|uniref:uncharacterized protein isoform X3 n=1 Tax=Penaeus vannamei TaxID=6689 RepID=UPI00387F3AE1